ncbi:hypothetical protein K239x_25220 [Planctomycetes bacterium K23_9]|uniref:Polysaccharide lyase 14 domain-containing protein n=2 Tax=Stieleria marina TaxID=1930275 RepID=A0A517NTW7_9BACT|nr:hypothetical protein K239x_25220 [Planctomycetes bacterium K23_9]
MALTVAISCGWTFPTPEISSGVVDKRELKKVPGVLWAKGTDRMSILSLTPGSASSSRTVRVRYPAGKWGPTESGASFLVDLPPKKEYRSSYRIRFSENFQFTKGGKLPGLAGGTATTGLERPNGDGWSARYMWRDRGELVLYLYHMDQAERQGDDIPLSFRITPEKWFQLTQVVTANDPGKSNGRIQIWIDGKKVLDRKGLRLRSGSQALVDRFYFSTFFGGKGPQWAPKSDQHIDFADFSVQ